MEAQAQVKRETVEDIILRHSKRGMHVLRKYMDTHYCQKAVEKLLSLPYGNIPVSYTHLDVYKRQV